MNDDEITMRCILMFVQEFRPLWLSMNETKYLSPGFVLRNLWLIHWGHFANKFAARKEDLLLRVRVCRLCQSLSPLVVTVSALLPIYIFFFIQVALLIYANVCAWCVCVSVCCCWCTCE